MPLPPGMKCTKKSVDVFAEMPLQKLEPNNLNKNYFIIFFKINAFFYSQKTEQQDMHSCSGHWRQTKHQQEKKIFIYAWFFFSLISY